MVKTRLRCDRKSKLEVKVVLILFLLLGAISSLYHSHFLPPTGAPLLSSLFHMITYSCNEHSAPLIISSLLEEPSSSDHYIPPVSTLLARKFIFHIRSDTSCELHSCLSPIPSTIKADHLSKCWHYPDASIIQRLQ